MMHKRFIRNRCSCGMVQHVPHCYGAREEGIQISIGMSERPQHAAAKG